MAHPVEPYARRAFAAGWASTGAPMTDRVKAGCAVAVALAVERADDPQILEVTLDLGRLEGMWALLFQRRERLIAAHTEAVQDLWQQAVSAGIVADAVRRWRDTQASADDSRDTATACAAAALAAIPSGPDWIALRQALRDALAAGQAEGAAGAAAIAADTAGTDPDWDATFDAAYGSLAAQTGLWANAQSWTQQLLDRSAFTIGRALHGSGPDDSDEDVAAIAHTQADSATGFVVDWAVTSAIAAGSLDWYRQQGAGQLAWLSAGDGRVCAECETNETNSPYPPNEFPALPAHPGCRCVPTAT